MSSQLGTMFMAPGAPQSVQKRLGPMRDHGRPRGRVSSLTLTMQSPLRNRIPVTSGRAEIAS
jgi:hypothetical protein